MLKIESTVLPTAAETLVQVVDSRSSLNFWLPVDVKLLQMCNLIELLKRQVDQKVAQCLCSIRSVVCGFSCDYLKVGCD